MSDSFDTRGSEPNWTAFATELGWSEQAHMIREFKELFGCTPGEAINSGAGDSLRGYDVAANFEHCRSTIMCPYLRASKSK
jgi:AraC-like DNA-binding protein